MGAPPADGQARGTLNARATAPEKCPAARKAVAFYQRRYREHREKMGAAAELKLNQRTGCPRYLARVWKAKAAGARKAYERWVAHHYHWWKWLPDKWQRIGACETGYGKRPGRWDWNSGTYEGAFGFYYGTWDAYKPKGAPPAAYLATPRQQYQCALNVAAAHGYGAWGCGDA